MQYKDLVDFNKWVVATGFSIKYLPGNHDHLMRERLLILPVMVALVVSIVMRQIAGLSEAVRILKEEGLLSYFWVGHTNGVQIQILATLIFYTVLNQLVAEVAVALNQPKEKI